MCWRESRGSLLLLSGLINYYAYILMTYSTRRTDAQFAAEYGTEFHRPGHREWLESGVVGMPRRTQEKAC